MRKQKSDRNILAEIRSVISDIGNWSPQPYGRPMGKDRAIQIISDLVNRREGPLTKEYRVSMKKAAAYDAAMRAEGWVICKLPRSIQKSPRNQATTRYAMAKLNRGPV
jgi:hypothetical protein